MKRLLACAALALLPGTAMADWEVVGTAEIHLKSTDGQVILFVTKNGGVGFAGEAKKACSQYHDELRKREYAADFEINGRLVKFDRQCRLDSLVLYASTAKGAKYISDLILDNADITISGNSGPIASFKNRGLQEAINKIESRPSAI